MGRAPRSVAKLRARGQQQPDAPAPSSEELRAPGRAFPTAMHRAHGRVPHSGAKLRTPLLRAVLHTLLRISCGFRSKYSTTRRNTTTQCQSRRFLKPPQRCTRQPQLLSQLSHSRGGLPKQRRVAQNHAQPPMSTPRTAQDSYSF